MFRILATAILTAVMAMPVAGEDDGQHTVSGKGAVEITKEILEIDTSREVYDRGKKDGYALGFRAGLREGEDIGRALSSGGMVPGPVSAPFVHPRTEMFAPTLSGGGGGGPLWLWEDYMCPSLKGRCFGYLEPGGWKLSPLLQ